MKHTTEKKTKPWFGGGAVGFILSKPIVRVNTAPTEAPAKEKPNDDPNKKSNHPTN
jgi:hypothetical protein